MLALRRERLGPHGQDGRATAHAFSFVDPATGAGYDEVERSHLRPVLSRL